MITSYYSQYSIFVVVGNREFGVFFVNSFLELKFRLYMDSCKIDDKKINLSINKILSKYIFHGNENLIFFTRYILYRTLLNCYEVEKLVPIYTYILKTNFKNVNVYII